MSVEPRALRERTRYALAATVLLVGSLLYLARPADPAAVAWLERAGLGFFAAAVRATRQVVYAHVPLPPWLRGSASDAAYAFAVGLVFGGSSPRMFGLGFMLALAHEVAQGLGWTSGTFDVVDLAVLAAAYLLAVWLFRARV